MDGRLAMRKNLHEVLVNEEIKSAETFSFPFQKLTEHFLDLKVNLIVALDLIVEELGIGVVGPFAEVGGLFCDFEQLLVLELALKKELLFFREVFLGVGGVKDGFQKEIEMLAEHPLVKESLEVNLLIG